MKDELFGVGRAPRSFILVGFQGCEEVVDADHEAIVDDALILESGNLMATMISLLVDLILLGSNEGALVDVGMDFDI